MYRAFLVNIFLLFFLATLYGQEPVHKAYTNSDGIVDFKYSYLKYTNDTLFILTDKGEIHYFDGITFYPYDYPPSKYIYRDIEFIQKGYFCRNFYKEYWYKKLGGEWSRIRTPESYIELNDTMYAIFTDSLYYFKEEKIKWEFIKIIQNKNFSLKDYYLYKYTTEQGRNLLSFRKRHTHNEYYDILRDSLLKPEFGFINRGKAFGQPISFNQSSGELKWPLFEGGMLKLSDHLGGNEAFRFYLQYNFSEDNDQASNLIAKNNKLHFLYLNESGTFQFPGSFTIPRANYQKIRDDLYFISFFDGLYKVNPYISFYSNENSSINKNIRTIVPHQDALLMGGYGSGFTKFRMGEFESINDFFTESHQENILSGAFARSSDEAWFFNEGASPIVISKEGNLRKYKAYINGVFVKVRANHIDTLNNGQLAFSLQSYNFGLLDSIVDDRVYIKSIVNDLGIKYGDSWCFDQDIKGRIWLGRNTGGVAIFDPVSRKSKEFNYELSDNKSFGGISMYIDEFDQLWIGTNRGLYMLTKASEFDFLTNNLFEKVIKVELPDLYRSNIQAIKEANGYIVIGADNGLSFIKKQAYPTGFDNVPIFQLLYGEDVNGSLTQHHGLYFDRKRFLWVSAGTGVLKVDMHNLKMDTSKVEIEFSELVSGNTLSDNIQNEIVLDFDKRNISLEVKPKKNASFQNNVFYDFLLLNLQGDTLGFQQRSKSHKFHINYLGPGQYSFIARAYKNALLSDSRTLKIKVPYALNENPYFWFLMGLILMVLSALFIVLRSNHKRRMAEKELALKRIENEKEALHLQSVISTFNPHFINNSLHWAQSRYVEDESLVKVIGRLSENIRYILKHTKEGNAFHGLKNEITLVDNYIAIQQERFEHSFEFRMPNKVILEKYADFRMPILQLQIHIENAIEHGLRNRNESSFVELLIMETEDSLRFMVTDDGCGREKAKLLHSRGTQTGIKMLKEIHRIFNSRNAPGIKIESYYEDNVFTDEQGNKYGTRKIITIPKNYNYEL